MQAYEVEKALAKRFAKPEYLFFTDVRDGGLRGKRTADALALNVWEGRGQELYGFEIKVARNDWLRELKQPDKAESIQQYCHRWWLVTGGEKDFVKDGELPEPWGHIHVHPEGRSEILRQAPKAKAHPWSHTFIVQLIRSLERTFADRWVPREEIQARIDKAYQDGKTGGEASAKRRMEELQVSLAEYRTLAEAIGIEGFEFRYRGLDPKRVGVLVKAIVHGRFDEWGVGYPNALEAARNTASVFIRETDKIIELLKEGLAIPDTPAKSESTLDAEVVVP